MINDAWHIMFLKALTTNLGDFGLKYITIIRDIDLVTMRYLWALFSIMLPIIQSKRSGWF